MNVYVENMQRFLVDYGKVHGLPVNFEQFETVLEDGTPQQNNGFDCGLAVCVNIESLSRKMAIEDYDFDSNFSKEQRQRISLELMFGSLLTTC